MSWTRKYHLCFFFNDTATTEIYTLSLHDALPISVDQGGCFEDTHPTTHADPTFRVHRSVFYCVANMPGAVPNTSTQDRKSTRLNSSHANISYAVFCLKKKKKYEYHTYHLKSFTSH